MKEKKIREDRLLTSHQVGAILQMDPSSITKWVKAGRLPAFRTPGGHHRIRAGDLVAFLRAHNMPVPGTLSNADKRRLLVVDDDPSELKGVARILKPHTHSVECRFLDKGIDALVHVGLFKPHAVLLDVFMPGLDGIEVCRRLNAMEETRDVNLVVVSARMTSELEAQAKEAGAIRCYQKPVPVPDLLELLGLEELRDSD